MSTDSAILRELLRRCIPILEQDAQFMADVTRHAPLDRESQAIHDSTEYESEKLLRELKELGIHHNQS